MSPVPQPVCALYYPHIHFRSLGWLKAALLYWEGVKRIVPDGFTPQDPPEVAELLEAGLVENVTPEPALRSDSARHFRERLAQLVTTRGGSRPWIVAELDAQSGSIAGERNGLVHVEKLDRTLYNELVELRQAVPMGQWVQMNPEVASLYMIALASEVGRRRHTPVITDSTACDVAGHYFGSESVTRDAGAEADGLALARLAVQFPSPTELENVPLKRVLGLRVKFGRERQLFREAVQARAASLATLPSVEAYRDHERLFEEEMSHHVAALRDQAKAGGWALAHDFLSLSAPLGLATALQLAALPPVTVVAAAGAATIGLVRHWILRRRVERAQRAEQPWNYLLSLARADLGVPGSFEQGMHQLVFD